MLESEFQSKLVKQLKQMFPGCIILKNDASYLQGIPDLSIFFGEKWAMLECKKTEKASYRPNQEYYLKKTNGMSFSATIFPENKDKILNDLEVFLKGDHYEV